MDNSKRLDFLKKTFIEAGFALSDSQAEAFLTYYDLLVEKNQVMNLTAITEFEEVVVKHFLDSCMAGKYLFPAKSGSQRVEPQESETETLRMEAETFGAEEPSRALRVIDVGTGAGFPGVPLKILISDMKLVLLDALQKRIGFLDEVVRACGLKDVETVHGRAEEMVKSGAPEINRSGNSETGRSKAAEAAYSQREREKGCGAEEDNFREGFDIALSRAVAYLPVLLEYCLPFVKVGGYFIAYKSGEIEEELKASQNALETLGGTLERTEAFTLPDESKRTLLFIRKTQETPDKYPRRSKKIEKDPL